MSVITVPPVCAQWACVMPRQMHIKSRHEESSRYHVIISLYESVKMIMCSALIRMAKQSLASICVFYYHHHRSDHLRLFLRNRRRSRNAHILRSFEIKDLRVIFPKELEDKIRLPLHGGKYFWPHPLIYLDHR